MRKNMRIDRDGIRHLIMRLGLGFVLGWFAVHELHSPSEWSVFVPSFVGNLSPVSVNDLIVLHGFLLLLAAVAIIAGLMYVPGCLLGMALLGEIIFGLWYDDGVSDLVIRDIGLLALAAASAFDPSRYLHLQNALWRADLRPSREPSSSTGRSVPVRVIGSGIAMAGVVVIVGAVLYGTGGATSVADTSALSLATAPPRSVPTVAPGPVAPAPTQAPSATRFDSWRYAQYSFQIYPGQPNDDAKKALAGFQLSVQDQGSTVLLQLKATDTRYKDASYTVDKGNTAYFVETTMRDDPNDQEENLGDDGVVTVDRQGYLIGS